MNLKTAISGIVIITVAGSLFWACAQSQNQAQNQDAATQAIKSSNAPLLQTAPPTILLADNLDEPDRLGWCIDTKGRGFSDRLHVHSCKPAGGDVQFSYEPQSGQILSAAFENKCMHYTGDSGETNFGLLDCDDSAEAQKFTYHADRAAISPRNDASQCVSSGPESQIAGPFVSRPLLLTPCDETEPKLRQWVINSK